MPQSPHVCAAAIDNVINVGGNAFWEEEIYLSFALPCPLQVALKIIDKTTLDSPKMKVRVEREISNMRRLRHCGVVEYFESK